MPSLLRMPEVAANTPSAVLGSWEVAAGETFTRGTSLLVVETAKAAVDVEAESDGVLARILVEAGSDVEVGTPIAVLTTTGETADDLERFLAQLDRARDQPATPAGRAAADATGAPHAAVAASVAASGSAPAAESPAVESPAAESPAPERGQRVFASPLARGLARDAGLELSQITPTGPGGRVVRDDVRRAIAAARESGPDVASAPTPLPAAQPASGGAGVGYRDEPHSPIRRLIASRLTESVRTVPHFSLRAAVRVGRLTAFRAELNAVSPVKISLNDLVIKAVAVTHRLEPALNVIWTPDAVRHFDSVDIAVAMDAPAGLVTPVVRQVDRMGLTAIATATQAYVERSKAGRLHPSDLEGGSITVSNLGMFGVQEFDAIINPPHAAILAVGVAQRAPVVGSDGQLAVEPVMSVTLSVDHRPVDGATAARWLRVLVDVLEHPERMVL